MRTTLALAALLLSLPACGTGDQPPLELDAGPAAPDAFAPPDYREEECIALCGQHRPDPGPELCPAASDRGVCETDCEAASGATTPSYCPTGGTGWRASECAYLCDHGGTCAGADATACRGACEAWSDTGAYCPGGVP